MRLLFDKDFQDSEDLGTARDAGCATDNRRMPLEMEDPLEIARHRVSRRKRDSVRRRSKACRTLSDTLFSTPLPHSDIRIRSSIQTRIAHFV